MTELSIPSLSYKPMLHLLSLVKLEYNFPLKLKNKISKSCIIFYSHLKLIWARSDSTCEVTLIKWFGSFIDAPINIILRQHNYQLVGSLHYIFIVQFFVAEGENSICCLI
jgi:hypothetical protein